MTRVLVARYRACLFGDPLTLLLLLGQAPLIGYLCTLVWGSIERDTPSLYFVMSLSAVWFGCINACREIVKERAIFERERFFGLSLPAYVASKLYVLAGLGFAQVVLLQMAIEWHLALKGAFLLQTLALFGATLCGTALGLLVSALASTQERAVGVVPLLILPQILFSEMAIPRGTFDVVVKAGEKIMPVHWAFEIFQQLAAPETEWLTIGLSVVVLPAYTALLALLATLALVPRRS